MVKLVVLVFFASLATFASGCRFINHIYSKIDGSYTKTACTIPIAADYQDAERICRKMKMELFVIGDGDTEDNLAFDLSHKFPSGNSWINGRRDDAKFWSGWDNLGNPMSISTTITAGLTAQDSTRDVNCLAYKPNAGSYSPVGKSCSETANRFTCEYKKPPVKNLDACWKKMDLAGSSPAKSACVIGTLSNYFDAEQYCLNKGMVLLSGFYIFPAGYFPGPVWVNGMIASGTWSVYEPKFTPLIGGDDSSKFVAGGQSSGNCLSITEEGGNWLGKGADCDTQLTYIVCQYAP